MNQSLSLPVAALSMGLLFIGLAAAQGEKPAVKPKKFVELVPQTIKEEPDADKLQLLHVQRHNKLVEALTEFAKRLDGHVFRGWDEFPLFMKAQQKLVDNELAVGHPQKIAIIEQTLEMAKRFEGYAIERKEVDNPALLPIAIEHRMDLETRLEKAKREAAKAAPAK